ncbi:speckle-type POZ protein-like B [Microplitis mediator]|uniref:speckle-type POZ protein-like B n=1 Tax=Microplitis mediator TaxID=375433 RepID=UPI00255246AA|nr:speckle-type POZ protein-like B [Microplitis mediator]
MPLQKIERDVHKSCHAWVLENMSEIFAKVDEDEIKFTYFPVHKTHYFSTEVQGHVVDWYVTLNFLNNQLWGGLKIEFDAVKKFEPQNHVTCNFYLIDADKNKFFLGRKNRKFYDSPKFYFPRVRQCCLSGSPNTIDKLLPNDTMTLHIELITYLDDDPIFPDEGMYYTYYLDPSLSDDFSELYKVQDDRDVMIYVQGVAFPVHKRVLRARCPKLYEMVDYHQHMSDGNDNQVALTGIKPEIFKRVLEFMYTRKVEDLDDHAENLLKAASKYELRRLINLCEFSLMEHYLTYENYYEVKKLAKRFGATQLSSNASIFRENTRSEKGAYQRYLEKAHRRNTVHQTRLSLHH